MQQAVQNAGQQAVTAALDPVAINVQIIAQCEEGSRVYDFPKSVVDQYPLLQDPKTRYLRLEAIYPLLIGHPINCVSSVVLNDADDRHRMILAAQQLNYQFTSEQLEYIYEVTVVAANVTKVKDHLSSYGNKLDRFLKKGKVTNWMHEMDDTISNMYPGATGVSAEGIIHKILSKKTSKLAELNVKHVGLVSHVIGSYARKIGKFLADF